MSRAWVEGIRSLLEAPAPAVLTTYRQDGSAHTVPVWFRWTDEALEVVIAKGDVKLRHLARNPRCVLVIFETVQPFRGVEVRGEARLVEGDVTSARAAIAGRYLGEADGRGSPPNDDPGQVCDGPPGWGRRPGRRRALGDAPVHGQVLQFQAEQPLVGPRTANLSRSARPRATHSSRRRRRVVAEQVASAIRR
jgi:PPOX class probable F420-dependent enzyme